MLKTRSTEKATHPEVGVRGCRRGKSGKGEGEMSAHCSQRETGSCPTGNQWPRRQRRMTKSRTTHQVRAPGTFAVRTGQGSKVSDGSGAECAVQCGVSLPSYAGLVDGAQLTIPATASPSSLSGPSSRMRSRTAMVPLYVSSRTVQRIASAMQTCSKQAGPLKKLSPPSLLQEVDRGHEKRQRVSPVLREAKGSP